MHAAIETWPLDALPPGTTLNGLEIDAVLGRDGFGITYRVHDRVDQVFAIKECFPRQFAVRQGLDVLPTDSKDADSLVECLDGFKHEAKALVGLSQIGAAGEGVVKAMALFEGHGTAYLVREYIDGPSLETLIAQQPAGLDSGELARLLDRLLHALSSLHDVGLLHCDIEPGNIQLREDGHPVLIDFGAMRTGAGRQRSATQAGLTSDSYSPVEQLVGGKLGPFSDLYALGMSCYRAIGGTPVNALTRQQTVLGGRPDPLPAAARVGAGRYPQPLLAAIDAAIAIPPDARPRNVAALLARLTGTGTGDGPIALSHPAMLHRDSAPAAGSAKPRPDSGTSDARALYNTLIDQAETPGPKRSSRLGPGLAVAGIVLLGLGGAGFWLWQKTPPAEPPAASQAPDPAASAQALKMQSAVADLLRRLTGREREFADKLDKARAAAERATDQALNAHTEAERTTAQAQEQQTEEEARFQGDLQRFAKSVVFDSATLKAAQATQQQAATALLEGRAPDALRAFATAQNAVQQLLVALDNLELVLRTDNAVKRSRDKIGRLLAGQGLEPGSFLAKANGLISQGEDDLGQGRLDEAKHAFDDASAGLVRDCLAALNQQIVDQTKIFDTKMAAGDLDGAQAAISLAKKLKQISAGIQ